MFETNFELAYNLHSTASSPVQQLQQATVGARGAEAPRARAPLPFPGAALAPPRHQRLQAQHGVTIAHHPGPLPHPPNTTPTLNTSNLQLAFTTNPDILRSFYRRNSKLINGAARDLTANVTHSNVWRRPHRLLYALKVQLAHYPLTNHSNKWYTECRGLI